MSEEKEKRRCSKLEIDYCSMWSSIKTVVEEHLLSENVYLHSAGRWSLIMINGMYLPSSANKLVSANQRAK